MHITMTFVTGFSCDECQYDFGQWSLVGVTWRLYNSLSDRACLADRFCIWCNSFRWGVFVGVTWDLNKTFFDACSLAYEVDPMTVGAHVDHWGDTSWQDGSKGVWAKWNWGDLWVQCDIMNSCQWTLSCRWTWSRPQDDGQHQGDFDDQYVLWNGGR